MFPGTSPPERDDEPRVYPLADFKPTQTETMAQRGSAEGRGGSMFSSTPDAQHASKQEGERRGRPSLFTLGPGKNKKGDPSSGPQKDKDLQKERKPERESERKTRFSLTSSGSQTRGPTLSGHQPKHSTIHSSTLTSGGQGLPAVFAPEQIKETAVFSAAKRGNTRPGEAFLKLDRFLVACQFLLFPTSPQAGLTADRVDSCTLACGGFVLLLLLLSVWNRCPSICRSIR